MTAWEVVIPNWVPDSGLSLNGRRRASVWDVRKMQSAVKEVVCLHLIQGRIRERYGCADKAHVTITFTYPIRRRRDPDGLAGLVKPCLDAMVQEGLLVDDDCEHITLEVGARVQSGVTATHISVRAATRWHC